MQLASGSPARGPNGNSDMRKDGLLVHIGTGEKMLRYGLIKEGHALPVSTHTLSFRKHLNRGSQNRWLKLNYLIQNNRMAYDKDVTQVTLPD